MNEFFKKNSFSNLLVIIVLSIFLLWGTVGHISAHYYKTRYNSIVSELRQLREQLESVDNRKRELEEIVDRTGIITTEAVGYIDRTSEILEQSGTTIREIRSQVENLQTYCDRLELYIYSIRSNTNNKGEIEDE